MSYIEKEKLIKADIASIENRVRHAFNQGYDLGFKDGKSKQPNCSEIPTGSTTKNCRTCRNFGSHHGICEICKDNKCWTEQEPTTKVDCIKKSDAIDIIQDMHGLARADVISDAVNRIITMPSVTPQEPKIVSIAEIKYDKDKLKELVNKAVLTVTPQEPKCKDCKWWKDSDGEYRRGCGAESQCPINRREVFEGNGYCYLFEPQESEDKE